jgi:hypothetical protein
METEIPIPASAFDPGCYIDCGHLSSVDLNYRIIKFASNYGWDGGSYDLNLIDSDWLTYVNGDIPPEFIHEGDFEEALYFAADDGVEWLNDNVVPDGCYWTIDDNSLYLVEDSNEDV